MLIDWFTVAAQILNFLILLALLKYFLYDRIVQAMDARQQELQQRRQEAEDERRRAEEERQDYENMRRELDDRKQQFLDKARQEADELRQRLREEAREETDELREKWRESLEREHERFLRELRQIVVRALGRAVETAVSALADESLQSRAVEALLGRLDQLTDEDRDRLARAAPNGLQVLGPFELEQGQKSRLTKALRAVTDSEARVEYADDPEMALGLEVRGKGVKLTWNLEGYLQDLERDVEQALRQEQGAQQESRQDDNRREAAGEHAAEEES